MTKPLRGNQRHEQVAPVPIEVPPSSGGDPKPDEVASLAYEYWQQRGGPIGTPEEDWFRAEEEIKLRQQERPQGGDAR